MKHAFLLSLFAAYFFALSAQQKFVVDRNFGASCGSTQTFFQANLYELFKLSNGKYMIVGDRFAFESAESNEVLFARYNSDGTVDTAFATNGIKMFNFDVFTKVTSVAYVNNKIYIAGHQAPGNAFSTFRASISRFNENGEPDSSFNGTGTLVESIFSNPISSSFYTHVLVQPNGKIVCFGFESSNINGGSNIAVGKRHNPNGTVDSTFNTNPGFGYGSFNQGNAEYNSPGVLNADGSMRFVYPARNGPSTLVSVKIDSAGVPVASYGTNGSNSTTVDLAQSRIHRFLKSGNNIYGLHYKQNTDDDMRAYALDANGNLNNNFSGDGVLDLPNFPGTGGSERPFAMHLDAQNRLYYFGSASFNQDKCAFYRADLSGNLDFSLAGTGSLAIGEFPFSEFKNVYFENDSTIIANIYTNSRIGLIKLQLQTNNVSIAPPASNAICVGDTTSLFVSQPNDCYTYNWLKDGASYAGNDSSIRVFEAGAYSVIAIAGTDTSISQAVVITVGTCTGIDNVDAASFQLYPNPTENILNIEVESNTEHRESQIQIIDMQGRTMMTSKFEGNTTINISDLAPSMYQVRIVSGASSAVKRFVKL
jgi:uncharacterized delta-60 repeat protein